MNRVVFVNRRAEKLEEIKRLFVDSLKSFDIVQLESNLDIKDCFAVLNNPCFFEQRWLSIDGGFAQRPSLTFFRSDSLWRRFGKRKQVEQLHRKTSHVAYSCYLHW